MEEGLGDLLWFLKLLGGELVWKEDIASQDCWLHPQIETDELAKARSPTRADRPSLPPEAKAVSAEFAEFLKTRVKSVGITDLSRNIQSFIDKVHKRVDTLPT